MLQMMKGLDPARYQPRSYIIADTDALSKEKAKMQETNFGSSADQYAIHRIPRARHVGQPWATVPWSLAKAVLQSATVFFRQMPDLYLGIKAIQIIYVESFARVHTLSLTGKILYYFADEFIVQWPQLSQRYKRAKYTGILI
ncbi:oligosaccharide biosynthesis protein Alg14 like-domain-containing protein [Radiomyces spectabilis]|uniref:oligosaccharide biosynthesis protein Alg14 like-domain-containing protein n=1 Tax=Radiomyces spectabilis TaxID=64574 RepID=UPI00221F05A3|nr:oligosaccharide biosynthesis protein Alg14 like-domain-containing protein [Radiomyces spectabilis]KAI8376270.1 oligosaccharide biosynthesis protein Alg14 like-domain-containing protein [Radiomyces spectabilis]